MRFYYNFLRLCNRVNKSPSAVAKEIGLDRSTVTRWKGGQLPHDANLVRIADYFGVAPESLTEDSISIGGFQSWFV